MAILGAGGRTADQDRKFVLTVPDDSGPDYDGGIESGDGTDITADIKTGLEIAALDSVTLDLSTDANFTAGTIKLVRDSLGSAGKVTMILTLSGEHSSLSDVSTAAGFVPAGWRPAALVRNIYEAGSSQIHRILVDTDGTLSFFYRDYTGSASARTSTGAGASISYCL